MKNHTERIQCKENVKQSSPKRRKKEHDNEDCEDGKTEVLLVDRKCGKSPFFLVQSVANCEPSSVETKAVNVSDCINKAIMAHNLF